MDSQIFDLIKKEQHRQESGIELIASENFTSNDVMRAMGTCLTNKYAERTTGALAIAGGDEYILIFLFAISFCSSLTLIIWLLFISSSLDFQSASVRADDFQMPCHRQCFTVVRHFLTPPNASCKDYHLNGQN